MNNGVMRLVLERVKRHAKGNGKPVLASWIGGRSVAEGIEVLNASGTPKFSYPDAAVRAFECQRRDGIIKVAIRP
jgi:acetyltransferase